MAFQQGLSGLNAASRNLDVIGHNIANANTVGMKTSRAEFAEVYASSMGASGGISSGIGVSVATVSQMFTQGNITVTGNDLDVAINGNGFYELTMPDGSINYTRAGMFKLDREGNIVTNNGGQLMGYPTDAEGVRTGFESQPLRLMTGGPIPARQTENITAAFNLDARAPIAAAAVPPTPFGTYGTTITAFDQQGLEIPVSLVFEKIGNNQWNVYTGVNGADPALSAPFQIDFLPDGTLDPGVVIPPLELASPNDPAAVFNVELDFTGATQFGTNFAVSDLTQDGYRPGELTSLGISEAGVIMARYSMDRVIYTALSGANAAMHRQQVLSHNLANVNTNGFRAEMATFRAVPLRGEGATTRVFALEATAGHLDTPGSMNSTGRNLDIAATGQSYFAIQGLDGTEAYTRAGALQVSPRACWWGMAACPCWTTAVRPSTFPTTPRSNIGSDGTVSVKVGNEPVQALGRLKMVTPNNEDQRLKRGDDGLFRSARRPAAARPGGPPGRRHAGRLQRQPDRGHGRDDQRGAPVRTAAAHAAERREKRPVGGQVAQPERLTGPCLAF
jgi:flagellar hook protein FlgE